MEVRQYANEGSFFAPCKVCGPDDRSAMSKVASNADEVKGINVNVTEVCFQMQSVPPCSALAVAQAAEILFLTLHCFRSEMVRELAV